VVLLHNTFIQVQSWFTKANRIFQGHKAHPIMKCSIHDSMLSVLFSYIRCTNS